MKKFLIYCCGFMLCLAAGCKKDTSNPKILLLKNKITDDRADGNGIDTTYYTYDDQNRVSTIIDGLPGQKLTFMLHYDSQGRIATAGKYSNSGSLIIEFDFYYHADTIGYYFHGLNKGDTAVMVFNDQKQLAKIKTGHSGTQLFTYDNRGNVSTSDAFGADGSNNLFDNISYSYDNGRNPFSNTPPNNYFFMFVAFTDPSTLINNVAVKDADTYSYTYNNEGFPIKAILNTGTSQVPIYYNYILK